MLAAAVRRAETQLEGAGGGMADMVQGAVRNVEAGARAKGQSTYLAYLKGGRLTQREAIYAKCYDCMGHYVDGVRDCEISTCPLYGYMPYRKDGEQGGREEGVEEAATV